MDSALLEVRNLEVHYHTSRGAVKAVNRVSFDLKEGKRFGLVESRGTPLEPRVRRSGQ